MWVALSKGLALLSTHTKQCSRKIDDAPEHHRSFRRGECAQIIRYELKYARYFRLLRRIHCQRISGNHALAALIVWSALMDFTGPRGEP